MATGQPMDLLNLRLSLIDRDFNERDYDMLLALDQVAGGLHRPPPVSDAQLVSLPVRVHSSPPKSSGGGGSGRGSGSGGGRPAPERAGPAAPARTERRLGLLGILPGLRKGGKSSAGTAPPAAKAAPVEEDDGPVCSVCLHTFADGTKVRSRRTTQCGAGTRHFQGDPNLEKLQRHCPPSSLLQVMDLPCRHAFCADCIVPWLRLKGEGATCPTCKAAVFAKK